MELKHGKAIAPEKSRVKAFAGVAVLVAGLAFVGGYGAGRRDVSAGKTKTAYAASVRGSSAGCEPVSSDRQEALISGVNDSVRMHADELKRRIGRDGEAFVNFNFVVDGSGRF